MIITDLNGKIVLVNAEVERLFGYQREELLGASIDILVPTTVGGGLTAICRKKPASGNRKRQSVRASIFVARAKMAARFR